MQATGSISRGKTAEKHNTRECYSDPTRTPENIDPSRTPENVVLVDRSLADVYRERFGEATEEYNAKQVAKGHAERQITDYLEKVQGDKKLQPMYEFVVQVGNVDERPDRDVARAIYEDWLDDFKEKFGKRFAVKQAIVHMDEATPHMHVELVPCAESKRGLPVQNSLNKAIRQAGFSDYKAMLAGWDEVLTESMKKHGIERVAGERDRQAGGVDIETYKRSMEVKKQIAEEEQRLECLQRRETELVGEIEELKEGMEPAAQMVAESVRTLWTARNDGSREESLAGEIEGLRERISCLERQNRGAGERAGELERAIPALREACERARGRFEAASQRLTKALENLREVPSIVSEWAKEMARKMGKPVYNPNSLDRMAKQAREVSRGMAAERSWQSHIGRSDGAR